VGYTPLYQAACQALASKLRGDGELGKFKFIPTMRKDGTGTDHLAVVKRDEDLATTLDEVPLGVGKLVLLSGLHEIVLFEPLTIQLGEPACMLWSKDVNLDGHPDTLEAGRRPNDMQITCHHARAAQTYVPQRPLGTLRPSGARDLPGLAAAFAG
jgi:hypothetical protein